MREFRFVFIVFVVGVVIGALLVNYSVAERPAGAVPPIGGQAEMPTVIREGAPAIREALEQSCDPFQVAAAIRAADVYRRTVAEQGLSLVLRNHWAQLALVEEAYVSRCR